MNLTVLLLAIALVDSGNNPHARGRLGELYAHQMMPKVYASYSGTPEERAMKHLQYLVRELQRRNVYVCPENLALAWNAGPNRALSGRARNVSYDYAQRVTNLYKLKSKK